MSFETWLAFTLTSAVLISIPSPNNLMVMAYGLRHGTKHSLFTVFGVVPGTIVAMILSFIGLGGLLAASSFLFNLTKWIGAAYLVYLGIMLWKNSPNPSEVEIDQKKVSKTKILIQSFTVSLLNPKGIIFYMAFMPQFISPTEPVIPQMFILGGTFALLVLPINSVYVLLTGRLRTTIQNSRIIQIMNRTGGVLLILAGIATATLKRNS